MATKDISKWQPWDFLAESIRINNEKPSLPPSDAALCGAMMLAAVVYGPDDVDALAGAISADPNSIRHMFDNLTRAGVFRDDGTICANWFDEHGGINFIMDELVGLGLAERAP